MLRTALNALAAVVIAFSYGAAGGVVASYLTPDAGIGDDWVVTLEYDGE